MKLLKSLPCILIAAAVLFPSAAFAESVFLKDGSIIEGKIVKETDRATTVELPGNITRQILRKDILRTILDTEYKQKVMIYTLDAKIIEGYIVDTGKGGFIYRKELQEKQEYAIDDQEVLFIVHTPVDILQKIIIADVVKAQISANKEDAVYSESVFLKDGSILEGKITETAAGVTIKLADGSKRVIAKQDVLRTMYGSRYKRKVYLYKMNGSLIGTHIVSEDRDSYTLRDELTSVRETVIAKNKVNFISRIKLEEPKPVVEQPVQKAAVNYAPWDAWYLTLGLGYVFPIGLLDSLTNDGLQLTFGGQYFFSPRFDVSVRASLTYIDGKYKQYLDDAGATQVWDMLICETVALAGYTLPLMKGRINLHVYGGLGYGLVDVYYTTGFDKEKEKMYGYPSIVAGIELPVRIWSWNDYAAPFVEYVYLPSLKKHMGMAVVGVRYAF